MATKKREPTDVHARIATLIREDSEANGRKLRWWSSRLGMRPYTLTNRLNGRTPFTLHEARTVAATLEMSLDDLVGNEDMPTGYVPTERNER